MGFCSDADVEEFFRTVPEFEKILVRSGITVIKILVLDFGRRAASTFSATLEAKVASAISAARDRGRADIKQKVAELAKTHGFSVSELFGGVRGRGPGKSKPVGVAKYANPEDKTDRWTGRGRKPNWLVARLKKGAKLADFEI
jgi:DNA-binding protein H-NS